MAFSADWFLTAMSERDSRILTQALTLESETGRPGSLHLHKALEQQHEDQQEIQVASPPSSSSLPTSNSGSPLSAMTATHSSISIPEHALLPFMQSGTRLEAPMAINSNFLKNPLMTTEPFQPSNYSQSSRRAAMALSAQATCGKASRKRSRATSRCPITVLAADLSNFRAMVQHLTGIPSASPIEFYKNSSLLKPQSVKNSCAVNMTLPTLDTSVALLKSKPQLKDPLDGFSFTRKNYNPDSDFLSSVSLHSQLSDRSNLSSSLSTLSRLSCSSPSLSSIWDNTNNGKLEGNSSCFGEGQQFSTKPALTALDELLAPTMAHYNAVDSGLFFDGVISDEFPHSEIARMA